MKNITGSQLLILLVLLVIQGFSELFVSMKIWNLAMVPVGFPHLTFMQLFWTAFVLRIVLQLPAPKNKGKSFKELAGQAIGKTIALYVLLGLFICVFK
jgi:hypothetical protein